MLARLGRAFLIFAVLLAQQTALAHDFWHATGAQATAETQKNPKGHKLCDLHDLLGTVLGVLAGGAIAPSFLSFGEIAFVLAPAPAAQAAPLSPHSRDPPPIS